MKKSTSLFVNLIVAIGLLTQTLSSNLAMVAHASEPTRMTIKAEAVVSSSAEVGQAPSPLIFSTAGTTSSEDKTGAVDGARVMKRSSTDDTFYVGNYLEKDMTHNVRTTYYYFGAQRVGMRKGSEVYWLHGDHLGSASLTTNITGAVVSEMRYYPFGETRWVSGTLPTDRLFTGQRAETETGLYDYNARMYSPRLGRFISADSIVPRPGNSQAYNKYAYVRNSPLMRVDPSGHSDVCNAALYNCGGYGSNDPMVVTPPPDVVPVVLTGSPYPMLDANIANPDYLYPAAGRWIEAHPFYNPYTDPNKTAIDGWGNSTVNPLFTYIRAALIQVLIDHDRTDEALALHGTSAIDIVEITGIGIYIVGSVFSNKAVRETSSVVGSQRAQIQVTGNIATTINGRSYSGHALDRMQGNGIPSSVVENTLKYGNAQSGNRPGTVAYYDSINNVRVIINSSTGLVITVGYDEP